MALPRTRAWSGDAAKLGRAVRDLRLTIGWSQAELGRRAGVSQAWVSTIEAGRRPGISLDAFARVLGAMGARLAWTIDAPYLGDRPRQRDAAHARCEAFVTSRLKRAGWEVVSEVEVGSDRSRGWIDVLAHHRRSGVLLVVEVKTELQDLGAIERTLGWYEREAWRSARRLGWRPRVSASALLLLATERVEARLAENQAAMAGGFPGRATELAELVQGRAVLEREAAPRRFVALIDPLSRRDSWLRSLRLHGRHTHAPYADYAGFVRARHERSPARRRQSRVVAKEHERPGPLNEGRYHGE